MAAHSHAASVYMTKVDRVRVQRETEAELAGRLRAFMDNRFVAYQLADSTARREPFTGISVSGLPKGPCQCVEVAQMDTLVAAGGLVEAIGKAMRGFRRDTAAAAAEAKPPPRVAVLDMASSVQPGGGYKTGANAQEEDLCRRTSLAPVCEAFRPLYPPPIDGMFYVPTVNVLRGTGPTYRWLTAEQRYDVGVLVCAAVRKPVVHEGKLSKADENAMLRKMYLILATAAANGHRFLVLGALGCGAYGNPPEHVARLWKTALATHGASFVKAVFAVLGDNYFVFRDALAEPSTKK